MAEQPEAVLVVRSGVDGVERVTLEKPRQVIGRRAPAEIICNGGLYAISFTRLRFSI